MKVTGILPTSTSLPAFLVFHHVVSKKRNAVPPLLKKAYRLKYIDDAACRIIVELPRASSEIRSDVDVSHGHA